MPIVTIQLMEGRDPDDIATMHGAVADAIASSIGASVDSIRIMVNEMTDHQYSVGGELIGAVKARRATAAPETPA